MILRLQELEFFLDPVQGLRDGELEGLASSLVRRLGGGGGAIKAERRGWDVGWGGGVDRANTKPKGQENR